MLQKLTGLHKFGRTHEISCLLLLCEAKSAELDQDVTQEYLNVSWDRHQISVSDTYSSRAQSL